MSKKDAIRKKALEVLSRQEYKAGVRWSVLIETVARETGENLNTCSGSLYNLPDDMSDVVARPSKGLFILRDNLEELAKSDDIGVPEDRVTAYREDDIYEPARSYLLGRSECTHAVVLGGSVLGRKWGTPDLLGAIRVSSDSIYKPPLEIVAVEIKDPGYSPVEALGQAMAYKLFAHRTWLVLPKDNEIDRIEGIAISANIGLVVFTVQQGSGFVFETLNRPSMGHPDAEEVNRVLEILKERDRQRYYELVQNER